MATIIKIVSFLKGRIGMNRLDYFQKSVPQGALFVQRKLQLPDENHINLHGVRGSGKSALVIDYLQDMDSETLLYIDFEDPTLLFSPLSGREIQQYVEQNGIELLILDHYDASNLESLPIAERTIIISRVALGYSGFAESELFALDYEEFLAFERGMSQTGSFNHFLKLGTLPLMSQYSHKELTDLKSFLLSRFDKQEISLLVVLATYQTRHLTINQIYTAAKARFRVSKDWLYSKMKTFQSEGIIFFIDDIYQKGGKKLILFDFALTKYLNPTQSFNIQFDAMVALALLKHHREFKTLGISGYMVKGGELIVCAPFESEESMWKRSHNRFSFYKKYSVNRVTIVTVANSYSYKIENIQFEALPFYEWSILNEDGDEI